MTAQTATVTTISSTGLADLVAWTLATGDTATAVELYGSADRSVQVEGDFGSGASVAMEGSIDGTNYRTLKDHLGNTLSFSAAGIASIDQIVRSIRPKLTGTTTGLTATIMMRRLPI